MREEKKCIVGAKLQENDIPEGRMDLYELSFDKALRKESGTPDRTARYSGLPRSEKVRNDGWCIVEVTRARVVPLSPQLLESSLRSMLLAVQCDRIGTGGRYSTTPAGYNLGGRGDSPQRQ